MTFTETDVCQTCGRPFQSNAFAPPPEFNPERTQMLTLPPTLTPSAQRQPSVPERETPQYIEPTLPLRSRPFPLVAILAAVALSLIAFAWLLMH